MEVTKVSVEAVVGVDTVVVAEVDTVVVVGVETVTGVEKATSPFSFISRPATSLIVALDLLTYFMAIPGHFHPK